MEICILGERFAVSEGLHWRCVPSCFFGRKILTLEGGIQDFLALMDDAAPANHTTVADKKFSSTICALRCDNYTRKFKSIPGMEELEANGSSVGQAMGQDPFGFFAIVIAARWPGLMDLRDKQEWWSELHHRFLIFFAACCRTMRGDGLDEQDPFYLYTRQRVVRFVTDEVSKTHPQEALILIRALDRLFTRI